MGIRSLGLIIAFASAVVAISEFVTPADTPERRAVVFLLGMIASVGCVLSVTWLMLRIQDNRGVELVPVSSRRLPYRGIFMAASNVEIIAGLAGVGIFGISCLLNSLRASDLGQQMKEGYFFVACAGLSATVIHASFIRRRGILLTDEGVVWNELLFTTALVPWSEILEFGVFVYPDGYNRPAFGIRFRAFDTLQFSKGARRTMTGNQKRLGWHCYSRSHSLVAPLPLITNVANYYLNRLEARRELVTGAAIDRIGELESSQCVPHGGARKGEKIAVIYYSRGPQ